MKASQTGEEKKKKQDLTQMKTFLDSYNWTLKLKIKKKTQKFF